MTVTIGAVAHSVTATNKEGINPLYTIMSYIEDGEEMVKFQTYYSDGKSASWITVPRDKFLESIVSLWPENVAFQFPSDDM